MILRSNYLMRILASTAMTAAFMTPVAASAAPYVDDSGDADTLSNAAVTAETSSPGERAWGILVAKSNPGGVATTLTVTDTTVRTTGSRAHGIQSGTNGGSADGSDKSKIVLGSNVSVETTGADSFGLHAIDGSSIEGTVAVVTNGVNGFGAFAESYSTITLTDGSISTKGATAYGLLANNDRSTSAGGITATGTSISTEADWTHAVVAQGGATITVTDGSVSTKGARAFGLLAENGSTINSSAAITTTGSKAHGAQTGANSNATSGAIHFTGGSVTTSGNDAFGLHAIGKGKIDGTVEVKTSGVNGFGAFAETGSAITLTNSRVTTTGASGHGLIANNDKAGVGGIIKVTDTVVEASGAGAAGVFVGQGGAISAKGGSIKASGANTAALVVDGSGTIALENVAVVSVNGPTAQVNLGSATDVADITFGAGTIATANNGTLLQVNRGPNAGDGVVKLTLAAGSKTAGDIIDSVPAGGTGATLLNTDKDAVYQGKIVGVQDLTAQAGSTLNIAAGTEIEGDLTGQGATLTFAPEGATIGGDVELLDGTRSSGGSSAVPIAVGGDVLVDPKSFMGGNWGIGGNLTVFGVIAPGNSIGVVNVAGDALLGANSVYAVEIDGKGGSDLLAVGGVATLEGGKVTVTALDMKQSYKQGQVYTILTAEDGVDGTFGAVTTGSAFLDTQLVYGEDKVALKVSIAADAFEAVAGSANRAAAAAALDSLKQSGTSLALYNSIAFLGSEGEARRAFEQLAGDSYASVKTGLIESAHLTTDAITGRLRDDVAVEGKEGPAVWATGFGSWIDHDRNSNTGTLKTSTGGFLVGVDVDVASGLRLGVAGGYSKTDLKMKARAASADSDNWHLGVYAGKTWGALGLNAGLTYTWHSIDLSRSVAFAGFSDALSSDYKARTLQAFGDISYRFDLGGAALEPFANLTHVSLRTRSTHEQGGLAALFVDGDSTNTTFSSLGLRASAPLAVGGAKAKLRGALGWRHAFGDRVPVSVQSFVGSDAFAVDGVAIAKDAAQVEAGFDVDLSNASTFSLGYFGQFGNHTSQNGVNARVRVSF